MGLGFRVTLNPNPKQRFVLPEAPLPKSEAEVCSTRSPKPQPETEVCSKLSPYKP